MNLTFNQNNTAIGLSWIPPPGQVFVYRIEWNSGGTTNIPSTNNSAAVLSNLSPGTNFTIQISAVAGDNQTQGDPYILWLFTSKTHILYFLSAHVLKHVLLSWTTLKVMFFQQSALQLQYSVAQISILFLIHCTAYPPSQSLKLLQALPFTDRDPKARFHRVRDRFILWILITEQAN